MLGSNAALRNVTLRNVTLRNVALRNVALPQFAIRTSQGFLVRNQSSNYDKVGQLATLGTWEVRHVYKHCEILVGTYSG